ncbi:SOS response-associated peptidase family protein [Acidithiobacillus sp. MC6.1]|nr:SOS response-associated peptidase family protein [Acidithiobacillus sp. MC6.1]
MCGRYSLYAAEADLRRDFPDLVLTQPLAPRYNVSPGTDVPILRMQEGTPHLDRGHIVAVAAQGYDPFIGK